MTCRAVAVALAAALLGGACDDGDDEPAAGDVAVELAERVSALLAGDSSAVLERLAEGDVGVDADELAEADVRCPRVNGPAAGDRATCRVTADDVELELDVEFGADGSLEVVAVAVAP